MHWVLYYWKQKCFGAFSLASDIEKEWCLACTRESVILMRVLNFNWTRMWHFQRLEAGDIRYNYHHLRKFSLFLVTHLDTGHYARNYAVLNLSDYQEGTTFKCNAGELHWDKKYWLAWQPISSLCHAPIIFPGNVGGVLYLNAANDSSWEMIWDCDAPAISLICSEHNWEQSPLWLTCM